MRVCIRRGAKQIGGTCVEIESQGRRLVLDIGQSLDCQDPNGRLRPELGRQTQALMVRIESRDGDNLTWLDPIVRDGGELTLGGVVLPQELCIKLDGYFGDLSLP